MSKSGAFNNALTGGLVSAVIAVPWALVAQRTQPLAWWGAGAGILLFMLIGAFCGPTRPRKHGGEN